MHHKDAKVIQSHNLVSILQIVKVHATDVSVQRVAFISLRSLQDVDCEAFRQMPDSLRNAHIFQNILCSARLTTKIENQSTSKFIQAKSLGQIGLFMRTIQY